MSVHYKFKSALEYDTLPVDGVHISVGDLKEAIIQQKRLGRAQAYDLQITNAETKEVYTDEKTLIPKNSSLIVARVPIDPMLIKKHGENKESTALLLSNPSNLMRTEDAAEAAEIERKIKDVADLTRMDGSEDDKINAMFAQSTWQFHPSKYVKLRYSRTTGTVPLDYKCYKCHQGGHWVTMCPLSNQDLRKSTGIPSKFLVEATDPNEPGVMISQSGKLVRLAHREEHVPEKASAPLEERIPPKEIICELCKEVLRDAVLIPCCANAFCDECIRNNLLDSEDHKCPSCKEEGVGPDTLIPNRYLRIKATHFQNGWDVSDKKQPEPLSSIPPFMLDKGNTPTPTPPRSPMAPASPADPVHREPATTPTPPASPHPRPEPVVENGEADSDKENREEPNTNDYYEENRESAEERREQRRERKEEENGDEERLHNDLQPELAEEDGEVDGENQIPEVDTSVEAEVKPKKRKSKRNKRKASKHESDDERERKEVRKKSRRHSHRSQDGKSSDERITDREVIRDAICSKKEGENDVENEDLWNLGAAKVGSHRSPSRSRSRSKSLEKEADVSGGLYDNIVPSFNPRVPPPGLPPKEPFYPVPPTSYGTVPASHPRPVTSGNHNHFHPYRPGVPPPNMVSGRNYHSHIPPYREMEVIDDPLAAFEKHLREKDERAKRRKMSRSRSRSRSPPRYRVRRSPRPRSWSRSRSRSRSHSRLAVGSSTRSPRSPGARRRWSRTPPRQVAVVGTFRSPRSPSFTRERSVSNRSLTLSRTPSPNRRTKSSPLQVRPLMPETRSPARPGLEYNVRGEYEHYGTGSHNHTLPVDDYHTYQQSYPANHWEAPPARYDHPGHAGTYGQDYQSSRGRRGRGNWGNEDYYDPRAPQDTRHHYDRMPQHDERRGLMGATPWDDTGHRAYEERGSRRLMGGEFDEIRGRREVDRRLEDDIGRKYDDEEWRRYPEEGRKRFEEEERRRYPEGRGEDPDDPRRARDERFDDHKRYPRKEGDVRKEGDGRKDEEARHRHDRGDKLKVGARHGTSGQRLTPSLDDPRSYRSKSKDLIHGKGHRKSPSRDRRERDGDRRERDGDRREKDDRKDRDVDKKDRDGDRKDRETDRRDRDTERKDRDTERKDREKDRDGDRKERDSERRTRESDRKDVYKRPERDDRRERDGDRRSRDKDRRDRDGDRRDPRDLDRRERDSQKRDKDSDRKDGRSSREDRRERESRREREEKTGRSSRWDKPEKDKETEIDKSLEREDNKGQNTEEKEERRRNKHKDEGLDGKEEAEVPTKAEKKKHDKKKKKKEKRRASQASTEASQGEGSGDEGEEKKKKRKRDKKNKKAKDIVTEDDKEKETLPDEIGEKTKDEVNADIHDPSENITTQSLHEDVVSGEELAGEDAQEEVEGEMEACTPPPIPQLSKWERDEDLSITPKGLIENKVQEEERKVTVDILKRAENALFSGRGLASRKVFLESQKQQKETDERSPTPEWDRMELREAKRRGPSIQITISSKTESQIGRPRSGRSVPSSPERPDERRGGRSKRGSESDGRYSSRRRSPSPHEQHSGRSRRRSEREERQSVEDKSSSHNPSEEPHQKVLPSIPEQAVNDAQEIEVKKEEVPEKAEENTEANAKGVKRHLSSGEESEEKRIKSEENTPVKESEEEATTKTVPEPFEDRSHNLTDKTEAELKAEPPEALETSKEDQNEPEKPAMDPPAEKSTEVEEGEITTDTSSDGLAGAIPDTPVATGAPASMDISQPPSSVPAPLLARPSTFNLAPSYNPSQARSPTQSPAHEPATTSLPTMAERETHNPERKTRYSPIRVPSPREEALALEEETRMKDKIKKRKKRKRDSSSSSSNSSSSSSSSSSDEEEEKKKKKKKKKKKRKKAAANSDSSDGESKSKHKKKKKEKKKKKKKEKKKKSEK